MSKFPLKVLKCEFFQILLPNHVVAEPAGGHWVALEGQGSWRRAAVDFTKNNRTKQDRGDTVQNFIAAKRKNYCFNLQI